MDCIRIKVMVLVKEGYLVVYLMCIYFFYLCVVGGGKGGRWLDLIILLFVV